MKISWFKKRFKRFSITHGYRSGYTINQFRTNLDYVEPDDYIDYDGQSSDVLDQSGNYKNETLYSNVNLTEMFSPLVRLDFEMNNSIKILAEIQSGQFAKEFILENQANQPVFNARLKQDAEHRIEQVGEKLRKMMPFVGKKVK